MAKTTRTAVKNHSSLRRAVRIAVEQLESRQLLSTSVGLRMPGFVGPLEVNPDVNLEGATPLSIAPQVSGALAGKVMYTSGGHGYVWRDSSSTWGVMRSYLFTMMEDMGNQDQLEPYAKYLLAAGATVVSMRPIGHQTSEVIVDNAAAYSASTGGFDIESGSWTNSTGTPYWSNTDGNDTVHYLSASTSTTETAVARFTPKITNAGFYPVYGWWAPGTNRADDTTYRINYSGGSAEVKVAQDKVGLGWVYLGNYYFAAGVNQASGSVEVSNKSAFSSKVVIADAVRFGNGMGDVNYSYSYSGGTPILKNMPVSGKPREDECALYWNYAERGWTAAGTRVAPSVVYSGSSTNDETKNFSSCDAYAAYMNQSNVGVMTDRLWISYHSNASAGTARGTVGLITSSPTTNQAALAQIAGETVESELSALDATHEYAWGQRNPNTYTGGYGEISSGYIGSEFDATIVEVAFHDNSQDATLLKNPKVRSEVGRATYHSAIKYFQQFGGMTNVTYLPEPPSNVRVTTSAANTNLTVSWAAGPSSAGTAGPYGNAATGYRVWTSTNGYGFDLAGTTAGTSFTLTGNLSSVLYVRVTATNAGGESMPSVVAAGKPQSGRRAPILIVNNFDRLDAASDELETKSFGTVARARQPYNNSFDYVVQAAEAVEAYNSGLGVEYCTDDAIAGGQISLSNYHTVIWMSGEQSTVDDTFSSVTQPLVTSYLSGGGKMFISGAEIAWDLWGQTSETAADNAFLNNTLHAGYVSDDAATYTTGAGIAGSALAGVSALSFDNGTHGTYDTEYADVLSANGAGASVAMNYSTGNGAAIQYASGNTKLLYMGFGFETIYTASQRNALMGAVLKYLGTGLTLPTATPDLVVGSDTGVSGIDNLTSKNNSAGKTAQYTVANTIAGATIQIFAGATLIGSAVASGTTTTVTTDGTTPVADGSTSISAKQTDGVTTSPASTTLAVIIDSTPPTAALGSQTPTAGASTFDFTVTYADTNGVNAASFDSSDVTVTGPNSFSQNASFVSAVGNVVTYRITAPGGTWSLADSGNYTVSQNAAQVGDNAANTRAAGSIGIVAVAVPFAWVSSNVLHIEFASGNGAISSTVNGANLDLTQGASNISTPLAGFSSILVEGNASDNAFTSDGTLALPVTFSGGGAGQDSINVASGSLTLATDAGSGGASVDVTIASTATALFSTSQHLNALNVSGNASLAAGGSNVIVASALAVTGKLDLNDNALIWNYSSATPLGTWNGSAYDGAVGMVASGRNGGDWSGNGIVTSQTLAILPSFRTTIGVAEAADVLNYTGATASFAGETVDVTAILFKYTYAGDLNLNGRVDGDDYFIIDMNYPQSGSVFGYHKGDINFDGKIDADDYFLIDANYSAQGPAL